ncbi:glycine--tRNA ligase [Sediminispirochaeta smaragdinae]|jgi:glycyl-tRNA synthetase|uniref:Glycine--tRNA ligase n=1 Tax=Sediminispirochaeta smaragdinae (strain DSM 11293 / JCM 15392 / SEBR 4228) TaxID=573413 RepID=E1R5C4_SEDSS|nr:glycine--tRNA ligase [Sediminispirochaeta smaragdinae]ADK82252.1 glycyl-tRNA synthetase [Sediminispirochaeta smaragdinae DSM 11293]
MAENREVSMEKLVSLCKRRGFVYQSSEIYGGLSGAWDYGPLGVELKNRVKDYWWREMTQLHDNIVGLDAAIMMHPRVWEASGHVDNFSDPLVDCKQCKSRFRADQIDLEAPCPVCGNSGTFTEPRDFNLMFATHIGPVKDDGSIVYLRPETAQGIFVNFRNVVQTSRVKIPFGIAQVGKAFRNEVTTKNFIFRTCEFEQMEMQFFVKPGEDDKWFEFWKNERISYYDKLGIRKEKLRFHRHGENELAHYAKDAFDIEYEFPMGWQELEGIHSRTDFDLSRHAEYSGKDLTYLDDDKSRYIPYVIETSAGLTRSVLMVLSDAYEEEELEGGDIRTVLHFHPSLAPVTVAVLPLVKKDGIAEIAQGVASDLREEFAVFYDQSGAIGRRYRRMDEIGTPFCVTIDYDTKEDKTVTLRFRDSMEQVRVPIDELTSRIRAEIKNYRRV